jgi:hypothetical protein
MTGVVPSVSVLSASKKTSALCRSSVVIILELQDPTLPGYDSWTIFLVL